MAGNCRPGWSRLLLYWGIGRSLLRQLEEGGVKVGVRRRRRRRRRRKQSAVDQVTRDMSHVTLCQRVPPVKLVASLGRGLLKKSSKNYYLRFEVCL
jgi:hypothetical protein